MKTIKWDCVLETTIKLRIGSFSQLLLGSILTVFIRLIHDHLIEISTNPPKFLVYSFTVGESVWCLCFYLTYVKHLSVYQYSLFNIQWDTPCLFIFSINAHFSMILLCLLNSNQLHLMDQTALKRMVVITLFILHLFHCLIVICTIQQMTLLSKLIFTPDNQ